MAAQTRPAQVPAELMELAVSEWRNGLQRTLNRSNLTAIRWTLAAVLPTHEQMVREQVAKELLAVDPAEWALAGQHAGSMAAQIARGGA